MSVGKKERITQTKPSGGSIMVKKNVLTPVLAGVLGVAVVGSGVGYFVLNKNARKKI